MDGYARRIAPIVLGIFCAVAVPTLSLAEPPVAAGGSEPAKRTIEVRRGIPYVERQSESLRADLYVPSGAGPFPGVVMVHGGAWRAGDRWQVFRHAQTVAQAGYSVMAISYRLAPQYQFPAPLEDCRAAIRWIRQHAEEMRVDPTRVAGYGYSAGAHLVCLAGLSDGWDGLEPPSPGQESISTRLQAIVAGGTPCDFSDLPADSRFLAYFFGGSPREKPEAYRLGSPVNFVTADDPPVFLIHGQYDLLVPLRGARSLAEQLRQASVRVEFEVLPEAGHISAYLAPTMADHAVHFLDTVFRPQTLPSEPARQRSEDSRAGS